MLAETDEIIPETVGVSNIFAFETKSRGLFWEITLAADVFSSVCYEIICTVPETLAHESVTCGYLSYIV